MSNLVLYCTLLLGLLGQAGSSAPAGKSSLDYDFFKTKVQPIFLAKRAGHARCISCHVVPTGAVFQLQKLAPGETAWNEEQSRKNFEAVTKLIAIAGNPKSPLLMHPLEEEAGGDFFHNGGKHFKSQNDSEWRTLRDWIMGQTSTSRASAQATN